MKQAVGERGQLYAFVVPHVAENIPGFTPEVKVGMAVDGRKRIKKLCGSQLVAGRMGRSLWVIEAPDYKSVEQEVHGVLGAHKVEGTGTSREVYVGTQEFFGALESLRRMLMRIEGVVDILASGNEIDEEDGVGVEEEEEDEEVETRVRNGRGTFFKFVHTRQLHDALVADKDIYSIRGKAEYLAKVITGDLPVGPRTKAALHEEVHDGTLPFHNDSPFGSTQAISREAKAVVDRVRAARNTSVSMAVLAILGGEHER